MHLTLAHLDSLKVYAPTELGRAIRTVVDGGTYVSSAIAV